MAGMRCGGTLLAGESQLDLASPQWGRLHVCCFYCVYLFIFIIKILPTQLLFFFTEMRFVKPQTFCFTCG